MLYLIPSFLADNDGAYAVTEGFAADSSSI